MTPDDILYAMLQNGEITLKEYLEAQELPSEKINRIRKAIKESFIKKC